MSLESSMQPERPAGHADGAIVEIRTTFPSRPAAEACGDRLVGLGLAACVQVQGPISSIYRWQGAVERAEEFVCTCKTTGAAATACEQEIRELHPYATPEILVTPCHGSAPYAAWVRESVTAPDGDASA
jgi:periplasmic divalent cation tolerance protein